MKFADKAALTVEHSIKDGKLWSKDINTSFEYILNQFITSVSRVDINNKVIDFNDGSIISFESRKHFEPFYYTKTQDNRG